MVDFPNFKRFSHHDQLLIDQILQNVSKPSFNGKIKFLLYPLLNGWRFLYRKVLTLGARYLPLFYLYQHQHFRSLK